MKTQFHAKEQWIALSTIVRKEVQRFLRIWSQTILPPVINQTLYFIVFGGLVGSQVKDIQGISYMAFLIPGLVMMAVINSAYSNVVSSFFGAKFQKNIEEMMVSPIHNVTMMSGFLIGGLLRGLLIGLIVFIVSMFFVSPSVTHPIFVIFFAIMSALVFSLGGLLNAILAKTFDDTAIIPTFILTPLTFFGGVFYPVSSLPIFLQILSKFNPILYMIDGFRYGFYGFADISPLISVAMLIILSVVLSAVCYILLKRGTGMRT